ncbi:unnamed protein product [Rotaria socialis]|uniref:G-protein coupled receptors family 1 profile domain-containing protein n=1 Tax=Rotaria socialis TaxID=392032 RepID=A0A818VNE3_9BILA|nr:unnamed protein product [Rotaria socialis]CAF4588612.1 unnamed protein product [Rotaria socialis]
MPFSNTTIPSIPNAALIATLNNATFQIIRYCSIFIFLFGTIGNTLNILVLSQSSFRSSPCAQLFLFASAMNLFVIISGLISRILAGWGADLTATNRFFCKLRGFAVNTARPVAIWYVLFAMIDRWLLSSTKTERRQMSSIKNARRAMVISLIFATLYFSHVIYCHEPYQINAPQKCYGATVVCRYVADLSFTCMSILPLIPMLVFGLMTINNVHQSHNRTAPTDISNRATMISTHPSRLRKRDRSLIAMLLVQIIILCILSVPLGMDKVYSSITADRQQSTLQVAVSNLLYNIAQLLHFLANGVPFYIYTLAGGNSFRQVLIKLLANIKDKMLHKCR